MTQRAASKERNGRSFQQALLRFDSSKRLLLLVVHDENTTGLIGEEKGDSNFAALCRNTLYSNKQSETAGGSYGLGKAVLWMFSEFSTVIFNSVLETEGTLGKSPRLIGRSEFPWHRIGNEEFTGSGWLGLRENSVRGDWASSVWSPLSKSGAKYLLLERDNTIGTSILVAGFRNPADEDQDLNSMASEIVQASARNFWPSIIRSRVEIKVHVEVADQKSNKTIFRKMVDENDFNPAFAQCWRAYQDRLLAPELIKPGDVVEVPIKLTVPAYLDGTRPGTPAESSLIVRLADDADEMINNVAFFRGTGMVVKYEEYERLSLSQKSFHGILICGSARLAHTTSDISLEEFLRAAEPPEHKSWETTTKLKELYKIGYKKLISDMHIQIKEALKNLLTEKAPVGTEGPQLLMKLFPVGKQVSPKVPKAKLFSYKDLSAQLRQGVWEFEGSILVTPENRKSWEAEIDLCFQAEDPSDKSGGVTHTLTLDKESISQGAVVKINNGIALVKAPGRIKKMRFEGKTNPELYPVVARRATVTIDVACKLTKG